MLSLKEFAETRNKLDNFSNMFNTRAKMGLKIGEKQFELEAKLKKN